MPVTAHFVSQRSELIVIERPSVPVWDGGRQTGTTPGKYHRFNDHQLTVEGQKSVDFLRERMKADDSPGIYEMDGASDVPLSIELLRELATAEIPRVREILSFEREGPNRPEIVETCETIIERAGVSPKAPGAPKQRPRHEVIAS